MFHGRDRYAALHRKRRDPHKSLKTVAAITMIGLAFAAVWHEVTVEPAGASAVALSQKTSAPIREFPSISRLTPKDFDFFGPSEAPPPTAWEPGLQATFAGALQKNESMFLALQKVKLRNEAIHEAVTAMGSQVDFRKSRPGDEWEVDVDGEGAVSRFRYSTGPADVWVVHRVDGELKSRKLDIPTETQRAVIRGEISSSVWQSFVGSGASGNIAASFIDVFAYTIDFATETQAGDRFTAIYDETRLDGQTLSTGPILAAHYQGDVGEYWGFYFEGKDGAGYYDRTGDSLERQFLKSPLDTTRVTSRFGRRFHPVLKKMKLHAGVDYGAPTGTPVRAVADGKIVHAGWAGAAGKMVKIRHSDGYETIYAHLSKIEPGIKVGKRVKQKTKVGRVGSTGRSTGPHLHFGMKRHGQHINPLKVEFARGEPLRGKEKQRFLAEVVKPLEARLQGGQ